MILDLQGYLTTFVDKGNGKIGLFWYRKFEMMHVLSQYTFSVVILKIACILMTEQVVFADGLDVWVVKERKGFNLSK